MIFLLVLILPIILWFAKWCTHYIQPGMTKLLSFIGVVFTSYMILIGDEVIGGGSLVTCVMPVPG